MDDASTLHALPMLRQWIVDQADGASRRAPEPATALLEEGYLDSLGLVGLIVQVEKLRGMPLGETDMSPENFVSLERIEAVFFRKPEPPASGLGRITHA